MTSEQIFFLQTLNDHINGRKTQIPENVDMDKVKWYAGEHQAEPIFYYQTHNNLFREAYYSQLLIYDHRNAVMEELEQVFSDLPHFIVKGPYIARYYPVKELRTMGDTDIVVKPEDKSAADQKLRDFGFEVTNKTSGEWEYCFQGILVELHTSLFYKYSDPVMEQKQFEYFGRCWEHYSDGQIDFNFHILFLFMHLRKHIAETGVGFRQFLDIAAVIKNADVDWDLIMSDARFLGIDQFIRTVTSFTERWFGVKSPYGSESIDETFYEKATITVFEDGVFGFTNEKNHYNDTVNKWKKTGHRLNRVPFFFRHLFWPYEKMIEMPEYNWLRNKKYLLPLAWAERAVFRMGKWKELKNRYYTSDSIASERISYLKQWGIEEGDS